MGMKKKKKGGEGEASRTKAGRGRPVLVEVLSSSSSDHAADDNASNGKESVSSTTNHPKKAALHSKRPKVIDVIRGEDDRNEGEEEEEDDDEEGEGGVEGENGRRGRHECFSTVRVRRVIKGGADWRTNQDALFLISAAAPQFLQMLVKDAYAERKKIPTLSYNHISSAVSKKKRYEFLSDFVPQRILAKDALLEKAALEEDSA